MKYTLIRSTRHTVSMELHGDGIIVRAPKRMAKRDIDVFVQQHEDWIEKQRAKAERQREQDSRIPPLSDDEMHRLSEQAREYIPQRVAYYAPLVGVDYGRVTIKHQHTRWGSCSTKHNLNFNCLLMLTPSEVIDAVVVHELCHIRQMNHSPAFYREVLRVYPEYHRWNSWLRDNGRELMLRLKKTE